MGQQYHHYHPTIGPIRTERHRGHPMTVASQPYNYLHISSGMMPSNHSMGTHPVYAQMGPINNTGAGGVGPPSGNPQVGSVQQTKHHHSGPPRTQKQQRAREDPSVYVVPVIESMLVLQSIHFFFTTICNRHDGWVSCPHCDSRTSTSASSDICCVSANCSVDTGCIDIGAAGGNPWNG
ncbi:hypothetical protein BYT27DRAFT_7187480 [Phlegmacium glaucopus]|nr:hypothetical protein BYT27DRAFT_7187480 [Phlegmacium glaucopus]